jgi:hypothetical protein
MSRSLKAPPTKKEEFHYKPEKHVLINTGHWVMCIPVVCTSHITEPDHDLLECAEDHVPDLMFANLECGWIINLGSVDPAELSSFSQAFIDLLTKFHQLGYRFLRLDRDGDVLSGLQTFYW